MTQSPYRRVRSWLSPVHPRRIYLRGRHVLILIWQAIYRCLAPLHPHRLWLTGCWGWRFVAEISARRREPKLTVAVDITPFWEPLTGIGWYLYRLLEQLADRQDLCLRLYGPNLIDTPDLPRPVVELPVGPAIDVVSHRVPEAVSLPYSRLVRLLRATQSVWIAAHGNRLLFAPNYFLPSWFRFCRGQLVATVHDLSFLRVPWTMREETRQDLVEHLERTVARAARVLTDSETVRCELIDSGLVEPALVRAVHLGPGPLASTDAGELPATTPERYVLHVGTLEPRKNLPVLLAAWEQLWRQDREVPTLVLCGRFGWKTDELAEQIAAAEAAGWLRHFGYLPTPQVAALYRRALCVVLASIYEGFGLPAVEAMGAGVPIVLSDIPILREVGGDAALFVPAEDSTAWAATIRRLIDDHDLRADYARRSAARASAFDWRRTADATVAVWLEVSTSPARAPTGTS